MSEEIKEPSQFKLLKEKKFLPFFLTQFLGAFNDNVFKNSLVVLLTFQAAQWTTIDPAILASIAGGIFILPFFLFSATAGQIADKYDKAILAKLVKVLEIGIMLIVGLGFYLHNLEVLFIALFLFGLHSTLFGPVKYAILPQHLDKKELIGGNALIEAGTFVAILIGTLVGGVLASLTDGKVWITIAGLIIAILGLWSASKIPNAPAPAPELKINLNPITETFRNIQFAKQDKGVFLSILAISWFWLYGLLFLSQFPVYAKNILHGNESVVILLLMTFTFGIGFGSLLCEKLSNHKINIGLVPVGAIGLTLFGLDFAFASHSYVYTLDLATPLMLLKDIHVVRILIDLVGLGIFGGFYCVPLYALMQERSSETHRARIIACNNIMNALFMVVGALGSAAMIGAGVSLPMLFAIAASINILVVIYMIKTIPEYWEKLKQLFSK